MEKCPKELFEKAVRKIFEEHSGDPEACHAALDDLYDYTLFKAGYNTMLVEELKEKFEANFYYM